MLMVVHREGPEFPRAIKIKERKKGRQADRQKVRFYVAWAIVCCFSPVNAVKEFSNAGRCHMYS